jgi:hypothetical protein
MAFLIVSWLLISYTVFYPMFMIGHQPMRNGENCAINKDAPDGVLGSWLVLQVSIPSFWLATNLWTMVRTVQCAANKGAPDGVLAPDWLNNFLFHLSDWPLICEQWWEPCSLRMRPWWYPGSWLAKQFSIPAFWMATNLWAMVSTVQPANAPLMVLCIMWSVLMSTDAVASSNRRILFLQKRKMTI